jgi:hypothetical protein
MSTQPAEEKAKRPDDSPFLAGKYKVVGVWPGPVKFQGRTYDLRSISLADAERLYEKERKGFPYLEKIENKPAAPAK